MEHIFSLTYQGKSFNQRESDNYVNVGQMCALNAKNLCDWKRLKIAKAYLKELSEAMGIPIAQLLVVRNGMDSWAHPLVAIEIGRWISPAFGVWCNQHIKTLMETGTTSLSHSSTLSPAENLLAQCQALVDLERKQKHQALLVTEAIHKMLNT